MPGKLCFDVGDAAQLWANDSALQAWASVAWNKCKARPATQPAP
jgi:hypothetical protein